MRFAATADDLRSLELDDPALRMPVKCMRCYSAISFWPDTDRPRSTFRCVGPYCSFFVEWHDIVVLRPHVVHHLVLLELDPPPDLHVMALEEYVGRRAFHFLRKATYDEVVNECTERLGRMRAVVRAHLDEP